MGSGGNREQKKLLAEGEAELERAVRRFFFLNHPHYVGEGKSRRVIRNREDRDTNFKAWGEPVPGTDRFKKWERFLDLDPPDCLAWLYSEFIRLHNANDAVITPTTIRDYEALKQFRFKLVEIDLIFRMKAWANDEKQQLEKEVSDG